MKGVSKIDAQHLLLHREHGTGYRWSWNCCNIFVSFCLRAPRYGLTLWCALGLLVGGAIQVPQLQLQLQEAVNWNFHTQSIQWQGHAFSASANIRTLEVCCSGLSCVCIYYHLLKVC